MLVKEIIVLFIVILETHHCVELPDNACQASLDTLMEVALCPSNETEYRDAVRKKNCAAYINACRSFEYHCVLNEWTTSLVEVCAPSRLILYGKCTEFNRGLKCIRESYMTDCKQFSKPCPPVYNSTLSFLYPGCYDTVTTTTKRSTESLTPNYNGTGTTIGGIGNQTHNLANKVQGKKEINVKDVLVIVLPVISLIVIGAVVMIIMCLKQKTSLCNRSKRRMKRDENNSTNDTLLKGMN
ncbi:uncharacterized protein LOC130048130 [Ostrea edulis]|uniref:uncharacterized protein LOC130048130 n=1 Tax=Ostrea edulis TaxID=37623 RepID=UPI0024AF323D|nr:uncharacterized protein LOC130048130 [Ostrea edulis]